MPSPLDQWMQQGKDYLKQTSDTVQTQSTQAVKEALERTRQASEQTARQLQKTVQTQSTRVAKEALERTRQASSRQLQKAVQTAQSTTAFPSWDKLRLSSSRFAAATQQRWNPLRRLGRYAAVGLLSCIFVYGLATSIPQSLANYALERKKLEKMAQQS